MASVRFSGNSDFRSKTAICCGRSILEHRKIVLRKPTHNRAILVRHVDEDVHQLHVHVKGGSESCAASATVARAPAAYPAPMRLVIAEPRPQLGFMRRLRCGCPRSRF